jgi:hypothetical protein
MTMMETKYGLTRILHMQMLNSAILNPTMLKAMRGGSHVNLIVVDESPASCTLMIVNANTGITENSWPICRVCQAINALFAICLLGFNFISSLHFYWSHWWSQSQASKWEGLCHEGHPTKNSCLYSKSMFYPLFNCCWSANFKYIKLISYYHYLLGVFSDKFI